MTRLKNNCQTKKYEWQNLQEETKEKDQAINKIKKCLRNIKKPRESINNTTADQKLKKIRKLNKTIKKKYTLTRSGIKKKDYDKNSPSNRKGFCYLLFEVERTLQANNSR